MNKKKWTKEEEQILRDLSSKIYITEIAKILNRSLWSVRKKAYYMGIEFIKIKREYTNEELAYIKENWGIISVSDMARKLKVSSMMIQVQADLMNLPKLGNNPYKKWTSDEINKLKKLSKTKTITEIAKYFKTTNVAITSVAYDNNIFLIDSKICWTEEDKQKLKELSKTMNLIELSKAMSRSTSSIRIQASRQNIQLISSDKVWREEDTKLLKELISEGKTIVQISTIMGWNDQTIAKKAKEENLNIEQNEIKVWTTEEIIKLKELSKTKTINELVKEFNRTSNSIKYIAQKNQIKLLTNKKSWTEDEYKLLEKLVMIDKKSPKEIAEILGRTEDAIVIKINRKNLKIQTNNKKFWTKEEEELLTDLWGNKSINYIAKKLNRTESSIKNKVHQLGLGSSINNNYNGLTFKDISDLFNIDIKTISIGWVSLGLKYKVQKISDSRSYRYVEIKDLYEFLEVNQNIWDSRNLEENILGKEPNWLKEKREKDKKDGNLEKKLIVKKQQLILAKNLLLEVKNQDEEQDENDFSLIKKLKK